MKKITLLSLLLMVLALAALPGHVSFADASFTAKDATEIVDAMIDGTIGTEWDDSNKYTDVAIVPEGTATIWIKHDQTNFYLAIQFTSDIPAPWLAIMFDSTKCMKTGSDGALFGDTYSPTSYADIYYLWEGAWGTGVKYDASQDGVGAIEVTVAAPYLVTVELKKLLDGGDTDGKDTKWSTGGTYNLVIAWDSDGRGNPGGGAADHSSGTAVGYTVFIEGVDAQGSIVISLESMLFLVGVVILIVFDIFLVFRLRKRFHFSMKSV